MLKIDWVLQAAERLYSRAVLKGHEFIRADKSNKIAPASAAEGCFPFAHLDFSAACLTPERRSSSNCPS
jgi:hypothetical protein